MKYLTIILLLTGCTIVPEHYPLVKVATERAAYHQINTTGEIERITVYQTKCEASNISACIFKNPGVTSLNKSFQRVSDLSRRDSAQFGFGGRMFPHDEIPMRKVVGYWNAIAEVHND